MKNKLLIVILSFVLLQVNAQFAPPAGVIGTTAIYKDSTCLVAWATQCEVQKSWVNILDTLLGKVTVGDYTSAIGKAGENGVVSLGDGGVATLQFLNPIYNGSGYDFAIFENSFRDDFLEFAYVEVSSDGIHFKRFAATCLIDTTSQVDSFGLTDCREVNNLAGKYRALYGTPFDLNELALFSDIDIMNITHVRLIDVVGSMMNTYASRDIDGRKINDPFPTPYPSCGFDLDAVGVIHSRNMNEIEETNETIIKVYPTILSANEKIQIESLNQIDEVKLFCINGNEVSVEYSGNELLLKDIISSGIYILKINCNHQWLNYKIVIK